MPARLTAQQSAVSKTIAVSLSFCFNIGLLNVKCDVFANAKCVDYANALVWMQADAKDKRL